MGQKPSSPKQSKERKVTNDGTSEYHPITAANPLSEYDKNTPTSDYQPINRASIMTPKSNSKEIKSLTTSSGRLKDWEIPLKQMSFVRKLGSGASGVVHLGKWNGKLVAIKKMKDEFDELILEEFKKEAELLSKIPPHENVALFLGIVVSPPCIVTEFYTGGSLETFLENPKNEINSATLHKMILEIASGMNHLHSQGVVHRDLASRNLLLDDKNIIKIIDFGMSRVIEGGTKGKTQSNIGPLKWMAPESIMNKEYSPKSDVYMFAMTLVEILTRNKPFANEKAAEVAVKVIRDETRPTLPEFTEEPIRVLLSRCWAASPDQRPTFQSILSFMKTGSF